MGRQLRIILGLNSGTSVDGMDAAICEVQGRGQKMHVRLIGHVGRRYSSDLRSRLLAVMAPAETRTEEICRLHTAVGKAFAQTARAAVKKFAPHRVDLVGFHGQTICHLPLRDRPTSKKNAEPGTLQIGDPAILAAALHMPVVSQFRQADMAVGGQGAPLVPWTDYVLFGHPRRGRVIQNIGGIANLTWLPAGGTAEDVRAFDVGPGNVLIDALVDHFSNGRDRFDRGGRLARRGRICQSLLDAMLAHRFFRLRPPKSCGREEFGRPWMRALLQRFKRRRLSANDWIATATRLTAVTIVDCYAKIAKTSARDGQTVDEIILCGGGAGNKTLVRDLTLALSSTRRIETCRISTTTDHGIPTQAKEAVSFAMLAAACVDRTPANLPRVTGARRPVILGQRCNPEP